MISVIIPLFNSSTTIESTIQSVKYQLFCDFEVIIVNDGSTDNSLDVVLSEIRNDSRFKVISQKNSGVSIARKTGVVNSKYDLIAFLDSDDIWDEDYLLNIYNIFIKHPDAIAYSTLYTRVLKYGDNDTIVTIPKEQYNISILKNVPRLLSVGILPFYTSSIVVKKSSIEIIGYFSSKITCGEDILAWIKLSLLGNIILYSKSCVKYNITINSNGKLRRKNDLIDVFSIEVKKMANNISPIDLSNLLSVWHLARYLNFLVTERRSQIFTRCFNEYLMIIKSSPLNIKNYLYVFLLFIPSSIIDKYILYKN